MPDLLKRIVGKLWRWSPVLVRQKAVRWTQTKFTASVGGVVFNEKAEVLLLDHVLRPASGWGIPGGFMGAGEEAAETLKREVFEETGLEITNLELVLFKTHRRHIEFLFRARAQGTPQAKSREINSAGWFALDRMPDGMPEAQKRQVRQVAARKVAD